LLMENANNGGGSFANTYQYLKEKTILVDRKHLNQYYSII
jgi:hypothetical protein